MLLRSSIGLGIRSASSRSSLLRGARCAPLLVLAESLGGGGLLLLDASVVKPAAAALSNSIGIGIQGASSSFSSLSRGVRCVTPLIRAEYFGGRSGSLVHYSVVAPAAAGTAATTMAENEAGAVSQQSEGTTQPKELGKLASSIMPHILNLYSLKATAVDYEIYAPNATFEDPLMKAKGVKQIKSAFYSMPKIFREGKISEYDVKETETAPCSGEILIDNIQHYKVWRKAIDMKSLIKLQVENGKVTSHQDLWDKNPLWTKDTVRVPLVGRATEGWRRFNMIVTHTIMGFGKDPKPNT